MVGDFVLDLFAHSSVVDVSNLGAAPPPAVTIWIPVRGSDKRGFETVGQRYTFLARKFCRIQKVLRGWETLTRAPIRLFRALGDLLIAS